MTNFYGLPLTQELTEVVNSSQFTLVEVNELQQAFARKDFLAVAEVVDKKARERAARRAVGAIEALRRFEASDHPITMKDVIELAALKRTAPTLFPVTPISATDRDIHLHVVIPTCCKPDQMESVARDVARSLHYSVGSGVKVGWVQTMGQNTRSEDIDVSFAKSGHRDHGVGA